MKRGSKERGRFPPPPYEKKPKIQFSKDMCLRSWWMMTISVLVCIGGEFFLQYTARGSMREVVTVVMGLISFVTVFINGGYITQNVFRDTSLNKNGLYINEEEKYKCFLEKPITAIEESGGDI